MGSLANAATGSRRLSEFSKAAAGRNERYYLRRKAVAISGAAVVEDEHREDADDRDYESCGDRADWQDDRGSGCGEEWAGGNDVGVHFRVLISVALLIASPVPELS